MRSPYEILRVLVEKVILTKYPFLEIESIDSELNNRKRIYNITFLTTKPMDLPLEYEIYIETKRLFKMAAIDTGTDYKPSEIEVWFKDKKVDKTKM